MLQVSPEAHGCLWAEGQGPRLCLCECSCGASYRGEDWPQGPPQCGVRIRETLREGSAAEGSGKWGVMSPE